MQMRQLRKRGRSLAVMSLAVALVAVFALGVDTASAKKPPPPPPPTDPDPAIAYHIVSGKGKWSSKLMVMNADGTNKTVVYDAGQVTLRGVEWSPRGDQLAMILGAGLYVIDLDGENLTHIVDTPGPGDSPAWSPGAVPGIGNGVECIAFSTRYVYVVPLDGSGPIRLPTPEGYDLREGQPTWSPSGTKLAFYLRDYDQPFEDFWGLYDFEHDTYTINTFSGSLGGVSIVGAAAASPSWSKTRENEIAWSLYLDGEGKDIWVLNLLGEPLRRLTDSPGIGEQYSSWSPDDTRVVVQAFEYRRGGRSRNTYEVMSSDDGSGREIIAEDVPNPPVWRR